MEKSHMIGKRVPRIDGRDKVTGRAIYTADIKLHDMLYAKVKRSPLPHAKIMKINASRAEQLLGVKAVITFKDVPDRRTGLQTMDRPFPARNVVRFVGEAVAAVAAEDVDTAEEAIELIDVEYEELPSIFDPEEAMKKNCPIVLHPDLYNYQYYPIFPPMLVKDRPNVGNTMKIRCGDIEKGFKEADYIIENKFSTVVVQHAFIENHAHIAKAEADGSITVWSSQQALPTIQSQLNDLTDIAPDKIRVKVPYVGGAFGGKSSLKDEAICVALAKKAGRPVFFEFTREESMSTVGGRIPVITYIKDGVKKNGKIVAREIKCVLNLGAYADNGQLIVRNTAFGVTGQYKIPNLKFDSLGAYTNLPPTVAFRGFGSAEVIWAIEQQMDMIAEKLGIDPVELRLMNLLHEGDKNVMGQKMHSVGAEECLKAAANAIEWGKNMKTQGVWKRGKGIALGNKFSLTKTASEAVVKVYGNGTIEVRTNATDMGQGTFTVLAQIAAEEFKVPLEQVKVSYGDTAIYGFAHGAFSSRQTFNDGNAVRLACIDAKRQLFEHASKILDKSPQDLETSNGEIYVKNRPEKKIGIGDLFTKLVWCTLGVLEEGGEILGKATWYSPGAPMDPETGQSERSATFYMYNSQAVEVAVNTETGEVKVLKHVSAGDCGKAINPSGVEAQLEGGIHQIIGMSLSEEVLFDDKGRTLNPEFKDYKIPTALDQPKCEDTIPLIVEKPHNKGPYGAKGIGEVVLTAGCPAIANAIYNAVGVRVHDLPIKPEKIFFALSQKKGK